MGTLHSEKLFSIVITVIIDFVVIEHENALSNLYIVIHILMYQMPTSVCVMLRIG